LTILSTENSSVIDLACFKNEMEVFIDDLTAYVNVQICDETKSANSKTSEVRTGESRDETVEDLPSKRASLE
jgi:hypothetical protein